MPATVKATDFRKLNDWDGMHGDAVSVGVALTGNDIVEPIPARKYWMCVNTAYVIDLGTSSIC
jgi:hypothetical protein